MWNTLQANVKRTRLVSSLLALLILLGCFQSAQAQHSTVWMTDFRAAHQKAKETNRLLLLHFYTEYCGPCRVMEREVLSTRAMAELVGRKYVAVKIDAEKAQDVARHFKVDRFPTDIVMTPDNKIVLRESGAKSQMVYLTSLNRLSQKYPLGPPVPQKPEPEKEQRTRKPVTKVARNVGLSGFCPVTLRHRKQWQQGSPELSASYDQTKYHFASREALDLFQRNPEEYIPEYSGNDPVIAIKGKAQVAGSTKYAAYLEGRLYLFLIPETRRSFELDPNRYINQRQALTPEQIEKVTLLPEPGLFAQQQPLEATGTLN